MPLPFREYHLLELLSSYEEQKLPLDQLVNNYFRAHKALGSKDRAEIAATLFPLIRWKGLLDSLTPPPATWEKRLKQFRSLDLSRIHSSLPPHNQVSFPKELFEKLMESYGLEKALLYCRACNGEAPLTVRINPLKTTRDALLRKWPETAPCPFSEFGIIFKKRVNLFQLEEFKQGLFEVQDEGSQLLAALVQAKPGDQVLDFCAGSGGKTLAFAHRMEGKGQIYLHDVRLHILQEARKRLQRAGIQNAQIALAKDPKLKKLKRKMDWVLVDAPCSGTGTLRRNPDLKWKFSLEMLKSLTGKQRTIFEQALSFLHPQGKIVYATCSLLPEENEEQIAHFCRTYNLKVSGEIFKSLPSEGGMDAFFGAVLTHACNFSEHSLPLALGYEACYENHFISFNTLSDLPLK